MGIPSSVRISEMSNENCIEEKHCSKTQKISNRLDIWFFKRKKRSPQEVNTEDSRLMRRNKPKNLHLFLSEIMRKLKHSFKNEKHDKRLLEKKRRKLQRSVSTKEHFFLERMTSVSQKRTHQEHYDKEKHLTEMLNNLDLAQNLATGKHAQINQRRIVSLPEYSSPFSSPGRIWNQNSTLLLRSASDDFMKFATASQCEGSIIPIVSKSNQTVDEISKVEGYDEIFKENFHEESLPQLSLLSVASPSRYISNTEEYKSVLEPLFIEYEISPSRGMKKKDPILASGEAKRQHLCNQLQGKIHPTDEKESVFKYVKAVLDAIDSNLEELYLKTEFSDQLLNPALINNIPFYPNQLCIDHELLFDCINEVLFEFCRFPQWVSFVKPRTQVFSFSTESIVHEVQKEVYRRLLPLRLAHSVDKIVKEDMDKPKNWLDIRCDLECIGFETSELILNELLEELMLDLCREDKH